MGVPFCRIAHRKNSCSISFWLRYAVRGDLRASMSFFCVSPLSSKSSAMACLINWISLWRLCSSSWIVRRVIGAISFHLLYMGGVGIYNLRFYPTSTFIIPSSTLTGYFPRRTSGFCTDAPLITSYCQPCQGQVTTFWSSIPSPSGPPMCRQLSSTAKKLPLMLNIAMFLPLTEIVFPLPSLISDVFATVTYIDSHPDRADGVGY